MALAPLLRKGKLKEAHAEDSEVLEKFRNEADLLYNVYLIENAYNVLRRFVFLVLLYNIISLWEQNFYEIWNGNENLESVTNPLYMIIFCSAD